MGAEKALRRLDGVGHVNVELEDGTAVVLPSDEAGFDPAGIRAAVRQAGFSAPEVRITGVGRLHQDGERLSIELGDLPKYDLVGEKAQLERLREAPPGTRLRVTGELLDLPDPSATLRVLTSGTAGAEERQSPEDRR